MQKLTTQSNYLPELLKFRKNPEEKFYPFPICNIISGIYANRVLENIAKQNKYFGRFYSA
jgi:hypothetical protein